MDQEELHTRILMRDYLEKQEFSASCASTDPCADMEPDEMRRYVRFLLGQAGREAGTDEPCVR